MAEGLEKVTLITEPYTNQKKIWPKDGCHILAQYDENNIVVYQAFNPNIARYAVSHQKFGGDHYSFERMSWIKTNFLWMMYRCGWASKKNQERILAITISRRHFEEILAAAYTAKLQKSRGLSKDEIEVRLQWDPDHTPTYEKVPRRAIQLGLKGNILRKFGIEWPQHIEDITDFVRSQHQNLTKRGTDFLETPLERVYQLQNEKIAARIGLDFHEETQEGSTDFKTKNTKLCDKYDSTCDKDTHPSRVVKPDDTLQDMVKTASLNRPSDKKQSDLCHPMEQLRRREEKLNNPGQRSQYQC